MNRRTFLKSGGVIGGLLLAGCTETALEEAKSPPPPVDERFSEEEVDLPAERKFDVVADGIRRADGLEFEEPDEFEAYLSDEGIAVEDLAEETVEGESILSLSYVPEGRADSDRADEEQGDEEQTDEEHVLAETVGIVAGGYGALVRGETEFEELNAELLDPDGRRFGEFEVFETWAEEYDEGKLTAAEYGGEVMHTLTSTGE